MDQKLPNNVVGYVVSMHEINQRTERIMDTLNDTDLPADHVTALGFLNLGIFMMRAAGAPTETVEMLAKTMLLQYSGLPDSGVQGKVLDPEEVAARIKDNPFMARGNDTVN